MIITERAFTTFEVAKACGVFHTTVINWVNKGKLKARVTPGGHRRIQMPDLIDFMKRFDMPIPEDLTQKAKKILIVEDDPAVSRMLKRTLQALSGVEIQTCVGGLEALMAIGKTPRPSHPGHPHPASQRHRGLQSAQVQRADQAHKNRRHQRRASTDRSGGFP